MRKYLVGVAISAALGGSGCAGSQVRAPARRAEAVHTTAAPAFVVRSVVAPAGPPEHWFFEWLSEDGNRALLRRLDGDASSTLQTRVVDVESGRTLAEATFPELAKLPSTTIGRKPNEVSELFGMLTSPAFGAELVRGARVAEEFPFGTCGRFSTSVQGGPIAFNAGDWLYIADDHGHVSRRLTSEAAYDPRFSPDGQHLLYRRATGKVDKVHAKYEMFAVPTDFSSPPRLLNGTAGAHDRFVLDESGKVAVGVVSSEPQIRTCAIQITLKPPFNVKRAACLEGGEPLVESVMSIHGRYVALTTQSAPLRWRLRVLSLESGKVVLDDDEEPGMMVRAISDAGLLVTSGARGVELTELPSKQRHMLSRPVELGHRGFFRRATELVVVNGGSVRVVDLSLQ